MSDDGLDYLKKLAQTVVDKEKKAAAEKERSLADPQTRPFGPPAASSPLRTSSTQVQKLPPAPPPPQAPATQLPPQQGVANPPSRHGQPHWKRDVQVFGPNNQYLPGTILYFEDQTVAIYGRQMKDKDYEMVYALGTNGRLKPQGIPLANYDVRPLGRIAPAYLEKLAASMKWDRDLIIFHLLEYEDCPLIPEITATNGHEASSPQSSTGVPKLPLPSSTAAPQPLTRGRKLSIVFGKQNWNAVYWGTDELGTVVAHKTHDHWALMHLDLKRFKDGIVHGEMMSPAELAEVEADITRVGR